MQTHLRNLSKGKAIANQMYSNGADIVFTLVGGDVGTGAIEAAKENEICTGADRDQSDLAPENVLTSAIKRVDAGVFETVKSYVNGTFEGGTTTTYGLEENAVGVPDTTKNLVSQDILDLVEETITKLKNKEITVPKNEEEYNAMVK
ncbi:MAG: BMP family ABC transporter substrate-binding protein [Romboutsia timonensis]